MVLGRQRIISMIYTLPSPVPPVSHGYNQVTDWTDEEPTQRHSPL